MHQKKVFTIKQTLCGSCCVAFWDESKRFWLTNRSTLIWLCGGDTNKCWFWIDSVVPVTKQRVRYTSWKGRGHVVYNLWCLFLRYTVLHNGNHTEQEKKPLHADIESCLWPTAAHQPHLKMTSATETLRRLRTTGAQCRCCDSDRRTKNQGNIWIYRWAEKWICGAT